MGVNTSTIIRIKRKARYCNCKTCCYYHSVKEEEKEYCSMNRRVFHENHKCNMYNRRIYEMELYKRERIQMKKINGNDNRVRRNGN